MGIKVPGSLGGLQYITEQTYGTTPTGVDFSYLGYFNQFKASAGPKMMEQGEDGKRTYATVEEGLIEASYTGNLSLFRIEDSYDWASILSLAYNDEGDIPSFTTLVKYASDQYGMFKGCKLDSVTLKADEVGGPISADISVLAQIPLLQQSSKEGFGPTLGDENLGPTKNTITYNAYATTTLTGEGATIKAKSFSIAIANGLKAQEGIVNGLPYACGNGAIPDKCEIELEYTVVSTSKYWDDLKVSGTSGFTVVQVIGGHTLTFGGCYIEPSDTSRSQTVYDETVKIKANSLTVV